MKNVLEIIIKIIVGAIRLLLYAIAIVVIGAWIVSRLCM